MLQTSPLGADWRPRFVAYDPATYNADDPATWPSPPAMYEDSNAAGDNTDPNFWGPDGIEGSEDDYYNDFDIARGWCPLRAGDPDAPGPFLRFGFTRYPDPASVCRWTAAQCDLGRGYALVKAYDPITLQAVTPRRERVEQLHRDRSGRPRQHEHRSAAWSPTPTATDHLR